MASTFLSLHYHIVFSTKERRPFIREAWRANLHEYLGGTICGLGGIPEIIGGVEDHVHLLIGLKATHCLADFMRDLKRASSNWIAENHEKQFAWQDGYAAFTVSVSNCEVVREYIQNQPEHHRKTSFQDELVRLLEKHGVKYDAKFLLG
jgi:REP element-mobilizing transposase RayT